MVILSNASVKSAWCAKELNAGLMRELEEKRVVVVPVLVEDCQIPTFLREKMYADFRNNFDHGLRTVLESVARITNATQGRIEMPNHHTDWSIDWGEICGSDVFRLTMVDHTKEQPYTILGEILITSDTDASKWYRNQLHCGNGMAAREDILLALEAAMLGKQEFCFTLSDQMPRRGCTTFEVGSGTFTAALQIRRLGIDTGRDILVRMDGQVKNVADSIRSIRASGNPSSTVQVPKEARRNSQITKTLSGAATKRSQRKKPSER